MKKSTPAAAAAEADYDDSCYNSPFSCLPDEAILEIFKKLIDLKTLCVCKLVSKQFYAIVHQVDTICYTTRFPSIQRDPYFSAVRSVERFNGLTSLCIRCPSSGQGSIDNNNGGLFRWQVKLGFDRIDSFVIISPASIYDKNSKGEEEEEEEEAGGNVDLPLHDIEWICLQDLTLRVIMLWRVTAINIPLLEKVSITDNWGRFSVTGRERIAELRNLNRTKCPDRKSECYVPLLELPVSGYVMKGVTLVLMDWDDGPDDVTYDSFIDDEIDVKHDKKEAAYHEAVMEIFEKHRGLIKRRINH